MPARPAVPAAALPLLALALLLAGCAAPFGSREDVNAAGSRPLAGAGAGDPAHPAGPAATPGSPGPADPARPADPGDPADPAEITAVDYAFQPSDFALQAGRTLHLTNVGEHPHRVVLQGDDGVVLDRELAPGEDVSKFLGQAGTYVLSCAYHRDLGMEGRIVVDASATAPA